MSNAVVIFSVIGICLSSVIAGINISHRYENERAEKALGNSIENIENIKRDCEKSLPRNKECAMVFDFVPVEADYE